MKSLESVFSRLFVHRIENEMDLARSPITMRWATKLLAATLAYAMLNSATANADDLYADNYLGIPGAYPTILDAMDDAVSGDVIFISGVFSEGVRMKSGVTLCDLPGAIATIDGEGVRQWGIRCLSITNAEICGVYIKGCATGIYIDNSSDITVSGTTVTNSRTFGLNLNISQNCTFTDCTFRDTLAGVEGDGFFVQGATTDDIEFNNCTFYQNARDGGQVYNGVSMTSAPQMTDVRFINCTSDSNDRQGLRTQGVNGVDIIGGTYVNNGGSGIQIEQNTTGVCIDGVGAINNGNIKPGEKGIWIDEATHVTIQNCVLENNPFGIGISQTHHISILSCQIRNGTQKVSPPWGGISIHAGKHHYKIGFPAYPGQPFGGTSQLTIENCSFENNGTFGVDPNSYGDVLYGDLLGLFNGTWTPAAEMFFQSNALEVGNGTTPGVTQIPFDDPKSWLESLQVTP